MNARSKALMIQGTTSDAGKTTLVAGLCRVFTRKGLSVAPFKPQNMALNSAVTADGGEIGRSQALQAQACGLAPHTDMNPILLKPNSDTGAQVIVQGHALNSMEVNEYFRFKSRAMDYVVDSFARLQKKYEFVLVEGAGSPAEINLRENDIANMGFAEKVDCPVILVADIDRGGAFAHLVGTLDLLSESEQDRIVGFIINRFRGDIRLLENGLDWLEERTAKPVLAVLPYLHGLSLDQEDAIDVQQSEERLADREKLTIKVPVFPRISNHTDFDVLRLHPQVSLEFIIDADSMKGADLVILPGSKSTRADLQWFREQGFDQALQRHLRYGGKLIGICGGFQMLGKTITDPEFVEGQKGTDDGLGYLDMHTQLIPGKTLKRMEGRLFPSQPDKKLNDKQPPMASARVSGYEIHCGQTHGPALEKPLIKFDQTTDGAIHEDGHILGSYLHGLFDAPEALESILRWGGLEEVRHIDRDQIRENELDRLADAIEQHMDWEKFEQSVPLSDRQYVFTDESGP